MGMMENVLLFQRTDEWFFMCGADPGSQNIQTLPADDLGPLSFCRCPIGGGTKEIQTPAATLWTSRERPMAVCKECNPLLVLLKILG